MSITVAQLAINVSSNTAGAEAGLGRLNSAVGRAGGLFKGLAVGGLLVGGALLAGGVAAVKMAGDFQASMTQLVTGAGESRSNLKLVSDGILQMATDTATSTTQLGSGMFMIESAGYHGAAALNVLKQSAEGAKVGNADLGVVANATTTIMNDYAAQNISASQSVNTLIAIVSNGKTHMQDLAGALSTILPTSSKLQVSLTDTSAAMATMTSEGTDAASAATYLRQLLMALAAPAHAGAKALKDIGLTTGEVSDGMKKSLPDTLQLIMDHLKATYKEGSPQYVAALKAIAGGSKQMQGILELTGTGLNTFKGDVTAIAGSVKNAGNSIAGWSDVQGDFNFKVERAKEVVETLGIKLGTALLPIVGRVIDFLSSHAVPVLDGLGKAFSGTGGIIGKDVVPMLAQLATWVQKQVVPALLGLYTTFQTQIMPAVTKFADYAVKNIIPVLEKLATWVLTKVIPAIQQLEVWFLNHVLPVLEQVWGVIATDVIPAFQGVANAVMSQLVPAIEKLWNKLSPVLLPVLQTVGGVLKNVVGPALQGMIGIVSNLVDMLATAIGKIGDFLNAVGGVKNAVGGALGGVGNFLGGVGNFLGGHADGGDIPRSGVALVGERGPELVRLPGGSHVYPNGTGPRGGGSSGGGQPQTIIVQIGEHQLMRIILPALANTARTQAAVRHM